MHSYMDACLDLGFVGGYVLGSYIHNLSNNTQCWMGTGAVWGAGDGRHPGPAAAHPGQVWR